MEPKLKKRIKELDIAVRKCDPEWTTELMNELEDIYDLGVEVNKDRDDGEPTHEDVRCLLKKITDESLAMEKLKVEIARKKRGKSSSEVEPSTA